MISGKGDSKMYVRRAKTSGWAAFDQKQRQNDSPETRPSTEPFPSLPSTMTSLHSAKTLSRNKHLRAKSFSSVIHPSVDVSARLQDSTKTKQSKGCSSECTQFSEISPDNKIDFVFGLLKELFSWADDSLIEDVMAAAGNDFDMASTFLKAMVSEQSSQEHKNVGETNYSCGSMERAGNGHFMHEKKDTSLKEIPKPSKTHPHSNNNENMDGECSFSAENLFNDHMEITAMLSQLTCVPDEPEWEEDDMYLSCRKDAIKMMRAATRHSRAASNSFLRGDHISAQRFSLKARDEWKAAQSLNAKAASEILSRRNENNGIWKLDLHGLHASEAVQAVKERLYMIETQVLTEGLRRPELPNSLRTKTEGWHASYLNGCNKLDKSNDWASHRMQPMWLEVITGIGNHSRGEASLPTAIRAFFADNGYRFDEVRPGVSMVRPKFRPS